MNIILLSNFTSDNNPLLEERIKELINGDAPKLGYIPSQTDRDRKYFLKTKEHFDQLGFVEYLYVDVDEEYNQANQEQLTSCDAVYLSGGNTFYFLKNLQKRNILPLIREMAIEGKPIIGLSAGSIMMSETIKIAELIDENEVGLQKLEALNLLKFDFMPHWGEQKLRLNDILAYSNTANKTIYTCNDGDGIVLTADKIELCGDINVIQDGKIIKTVSMKVGE